MRHRFQFVEWNSHQIIIDRVSMGGCQTCKISELDSEWSFDMFKTSNQQTAYGLINQKERQTWEHHIYIAGLPMDSFWIESNLYHHTCFKQIKKDIMRTFPDAQFFGIKANLERFELLLQKFALYFPRIGYTQGVNFLAGYLLLCGFEDEAAFKILSRVCVHQQILALGLYQDEFPLNRLYCEVFWKLLWKKMPKLAERIADSSLPDEMWIFQWFISFFLYSFPIDAVKSFWNYFLLKKEFALVLIALGIVKCLRKDLLRFEDNDQIEFFQFFQGLKTMQVFRQKVDIKKVLCFANSISKPDIDQAIQETTCYENPYRRYFECKNPMQQREQWIKMITRLDSDRRAFRTNPNSSVYQRNREVTEHIDTFMLSRINKLYKSDVKKSKATFRNSTFSIIKDISLVHSLPDDHRLGKKANSIIIQEANLPRKQKENSAKYF